MILNEKHCLNNDSRKLHIITARESAFFANIYSAFLGYFLDVSSVSITTDSIFFKTL